MSPDSKQIPDESVDGQQFLRVTDRLEALHLPLPTSCWVMLDFGSVVGVLRRVVND